MPSPDGFPEAACSVARGERMALPVPLALDTDSLIRPPYPLLVKQHGRHHH